MYNFIGRAEATVNGLPEELRQLNVSGVYSNRLFEDGTRNYSANELCTRQDCGGENILREVRRVKGVKLNQSGIIYCSNCPHRESD